MLAPLCGVCARSNRPLQSRRSARDLTAVRQFLSLPDTSVCHFCTYAGNATVLNLFTLHSTGAVLDCSCTFFFLLLRAHRYSMHSTQQSVVQQSHLPLFSYCTVCSFWLLNVKRETDNLPVDTAIHSCSRYIGDGRQR